MRNLLVSASPTLVAALLLFAAPFAHAQDGGKMHVSKMTAKMNHAGPVAADYCVVKDGKMLLNKGGKLAPLTKELTLSDGSVCRTDGTCTRKDGTAVTLADGQCVMMNGKMNTVSSIKAGHQNSDKMGGTKM